MAFDKNATGGNYSPVSPQPRLVKSIHSGFVRGEYSGISITVVIPEKIEMAFFSNICQYLLKWFLKMGSDKIIY